MEEKEFSDLLDLNSYYTLFLYMNKVPSVLTSTKTTNFRMTSVSFQ